MLVKLELVSLLANGVILALGAYIWVSLTKRVDKVEEIQGKRTDQFITKDSCVLRAALVDERVNNITHALEVFEQSRKEDSKIMNNKLDAMTETMIDIRECMVKLSAGVDCE